MSVMLTAQQPISTTKTITRVSNDPFYNFASLLPSHLFTLTTTAYLSIRLYQFIQFYFTFVYIFFVFVILNFYFYFIEKPVDDCYAYVICRLFNATAFYS